MSNDGRKNKGKEKATSSSSSKEEKSLPRISSFSIRCDQESFEIVLEVMEHLFPKAPKDFLHDYAWGACVLSDPAAVAGALRRLDELVREALREYIAEAFGIRFYPENFVSMCNSNVISCVADVSLACRPDQNGVECYPVSVSKLLKTCFRKLGVTKLNLDAPSAVFSDAASQFFMPVVRKGCLFVDGVTTGHGEFTHSIQWLILTCARSLNLAPMVNDIGDLYRQAVDIESALGLAFEKAGTPEVGPKTAWDFVLDCFLPTKSQASNESQYISGETIRIFDLGTSLFTTNFRSPRALQYALFNRIADERFSYHYTEDFREAAAVPKQCPLLCALLANHAQRRGLAIDTSENSFRARYSELAEDKFKRLKGTGHGSYTTALEDSNTRTGAKQRAEPRYTFAAIPKEK